MLLQERIFKIMELLNKRSFVTVQEFIKELGISKSTVNRDLKDLEEKGMIYRERGGAVKIELMETLSNLNEPPVGSKELIHVEEKDIICKIASQEIKYGECIFLDAGTTPAYIIPYIVNKNIKLITNSVYLVKKIPQNFAGDIYVLGGEYRLDYDMNFGALTLEDIEKFHFDRAFMSASGLNISSEEIFSIEFGVGAIKKAIMKRANFNYLLVDDSKFNIRGLSTWSNFRKFEKIFVNKFPIGIKKPDNFIVCSK